jgi:hypothetical protein
MANGKTPRKSNRNLTDKLLEYEVKDKRGGDVVGVESKDG